MLFDPDGIIPAAIKGFIGHPAEIPDSGKLVAKKLERLLERPCYESWFFDKGDLLGNGVSIPALGNQEAWFTAAAETLDLPDLCPCDIVGPICETGDFLARGRDLPPMQRGDVVAIFSAGAYGMSMSSNYNDHGRSAEVLVDGKKAVVINERQKLASLLETERKPRDLTLNPVLSSEF